MEKKKGDKTKESFTIDLPAPGPDDKAKMDLLDTRITIDGADAKLTKKIYFMIATLFNVDAKKAMKEGLEKKQAILKKQMALLEDSGDEEEEDEDEEEGVLDLADEEEG